jgi:hypothetical protein
MLSIAFIVFIVFILGSLIFVSRYVLSEENSLGGYVTSTQDLLDDVNEVEVPIDEVDTLTSLEQRNIDRFKFNSFEDSITDFSILNVDEDKGIISFVFDSKIEQFENIYYIVLKDEIRLEEGFDIIYITETSSVSYGRVFSIEDGKYKVFNSDSKEVTYVVRSDILGKILFKDESQN